MSDQAEHLRRLMQQRAGGAGSATRSAIPPSVPTRRISFGPDRAASPRPGREASPGRGGDAARPSPRFARAIAVSSGKGGVGKTNLAVNLCVAFASIGRRAVLIDADLGLANSDLLCNLTPRYTLDDVAHDRCALVEALLDAPGGFRILPGAAGVARMADLSSARQQALLDRLSELESASDVLIIDTGAGISRGVLAFAAAAQTLLVVATPEPTSLTDAYGLIKSVARRTDETIIQVVMNMARTESEARDAFRRLERVCRTFINRPIGLAGIILEDPAVRQAVHQRTPITLLAPHGRTSRAVVEIARGLLDEGEREADARGAANGFISRLTRWIARG